MSSASASVLPTYLLLMSSECSSFFLYFLFFLYRWCREKKRRESSNSKNLCVLFHLFIEEVVRERERGERKEWCGGKSRVVLMAGRQPTNLYCLCILTIFALTHLSTHLLTSSTFTFDQMSLPLYN